MYGALILTLLLAPALASAGYFSYRLVKALSLLSAAVSLSLSLYLFLQGETVEAFGGFFYVDRLASAFLVMISSVYLLSTVYSFYYVEERGLIGERLYYVLLDLFTSSMMFTVIVNDYGLMWAGVELTTVTSALLVAFERTDVSLEAAWRYIIIVSSGITVAIISLVLIYYNFHTLSITEVLAKAPAVGSEAVRAAVAVALIGLGTKVGVFPMYTWLPDAHSEAPSPVSAMFSGVLLPTALYALYKIYQVYPLTNLYVIFGTLSIVTASIILMHQWHIKRMFAYSTIVNMNLALIGFAVGQPVGATLLLMAHAFGKAGAFYSSGVVMRFFGKRIDGISGVWRLRLTSSALLLSSFAVTGTPPFATFIGEFFILRSLLERGFVVEFALLVAFLAMEFISINYHVSRMVFGGNAEEKREEPKNLSLVSLASAVIPLAMGVVLLALGWAP